MSVLTKSVMGFLQYYEARGYYYVIRLELCLEVV